MQQAETQTKPGALHSLHETRSGSVRCPPRVLLGYRVVIARIRGHLDSQASGFDSDGEQVVDRRFLEVVAVRLPYRLDRVRSDEHDLHVAVPPVLELEELVCRCGLVCVDERVLANKDAVGSVAAAAGWGARRRSADRTAVAARGAPMFRRAQRCPIANYPIQSTRPIHLCWFSAYQRIVCSTPSSHETFGIQPVSAVSFSWPTRSAITSLAPGR